MSRLSNERAKEQVGNLFDLVLIASVRARELTNGHAPHVTPTGKSISTALQEIEEGHVGRDYLKKLRRK